MRFGGGSFFLPSSTTVPVPLNAGISSIQFGDPTSYPPDLNRIVISCNGNAPPLNSTTYGSAVPSLEISERVRLFSMSIRAELIAILSHVEKLQAPGN